MKYVYLQKMSEEEIEVINKTIKKSFKQTEQRKPLYVKNELEKIYPNEKWSAIYLYQAINLDYSFQVDGSIYCCDYNERRIIVYKNNIIYQKPKNEANKINENIFETEKIKSLQNKIEEKEIEIRNLKNKIKEMEDNYGFNKTFYSRDQMLALNFISMDQKLHFAVPCTKKDLFVDVEKKIYDKYPEYRQTNNNFIVQGKKILKFKTIEENGLESGITIIMSNI